jgi:multidrug resistance efflux pump
MTDQHIDVKSVALAHPKVDAFTGLRNSNSLAEASAGWAAAMLSSVDGDMARVEFCAVFLPDKNTGRMVMAGGAPQSRRATQSLVASVETAASSKTAAVREPKGRVQLATIALPVLVGGHVYAVLGIEQLTGTQDAMRATLRHLQWGGAWMRDLARKQAADYDKVKYYQAVEALNSIVGVAERKGFDTAATAAVTDLASRFHCDRVSLGFRRFKSTRIQAVSHSAQFSRRMNLVRLLAAAQDEAVDQRSTVIWPQSDTDDIIIARAHEELAKEYAIGSVFTAPLYANDTFVGALTFERPADNGFTQNELDMLEALTTVLAPILLEKLENDRWLITKTLIVLRNQTAKLIGPAFFARKLVVLAIVALVVFFSIAQTTQQVAGNATIISASQRAIVAPFEGFIALAPKRAGDLVKQGEVLVQFDDRELALERLRLTTTLQLEQLEFDRAVAERDRSQTQIRKSAIDQVNAQIRLLDEQLNRTQMVSPIDGVIISGDLSQAIGSSASRGQELFTVSPENEFRVELMVNEKDIDDVLVDLAAHLRLTALPDETLPLKITKITPVAEYLNGQTSFLVEARLLDGHEKLRPGMEGAARIDIAQAKLFAVWTQPIMDWARLTMWKYWPS